LIIRSRANATESLLSLKVSQCFKCRAKQLEEKEYLRSSAPPPSNKIQIGRSDALRRPHRVRLLLVEGQPRIAVSPTGNDGNNIHATMIRPEPLEAIPMRPSCRD
jgi:hypothetical protein